MWKHFIYRFGKLKIDEVIPLIQREKDNKRVKKIFFGEEVGVDTIKLNVFKAKGIICAGCGLIGSFFAVEEPKDKCASVINLYGINTYGEEIIFTVDHIITKRDGGSNKLENLQTMCINCNRKKGGNSNYFLKKPLIFQKSMV